MIYDKEANESAGAGTSRFAEEEGGRKADSDAAKDINEKNGEDIEEEGVASATLNPVTPRRRLFDSSDEEGGRTAIPSRKVR